MENNLIKNKPPEPTEKLNLNKKTKINLTLDFTLVTLFSIFFIMNIFLFSKMELIEQKLYKIKNHNYFSLLKIVDFNTFKIFKKASYIILSILAGLEFLILYINIIYLIFHPFIGLKLNFVINISHFGIIILKILLQGNRPFWKYQNNKLIEETLCKTDYASPSPSIFFFSFFYLYSILSFQKLKKQKLKLLYRFFIFFIHLILIFIIILIFMGETFDEFFHQLIFSTVLGYILICFLLAKDKNIHNFIFQTLKNIYNARKYKIKIFFYITGLMIITLIASLFIDENNIYSIKQKLKNCKDVKLFGIKESLKDLDYLFNIVGAVWGSSFTLDKNLRKWWGKSSKAILIIRLIIIIIFNGAFITLKYFLPRIIIDAEFNFVINILINFLQNFLTFGIIPLIFDKFGLISKDGQINLFKPSLFKKEKDDEMIILNMDNNEEDKKEKEKDKNENKKEENAKINIIKKENDKNDKDENINNINQKNIEENKEIYGDSNLVENVQNEDEEEGYLYLEGIDEDNQNEIIK